MEAKRRGRRVWVHQARNHNDEQERTAPNAQSSRYKREKIRYDVGVEEEDGMGRDDEQRDGDEEVAKDLRSFCRRKRVNPQRKTTRETCASSLLSIEKPMMGYRMMLVNWITDAAAPARVADTP